ncbi:hypothetical protein C9374_013679 [Naegleria lovaniensis]|uniref:CCR4-NOT transcription complex subunit 10 n=1 Tax=Naegleria lovaniensis TaxID=51637 RepID=A0AA88G9J4_NAELO|nr:uncharacterized protein C9374_013679 [Naegleria lovaniensis]KAG2372671.1 hypothetical protein C9374_013679 [Naegleria lovaniensis]
MYHFNKKEYESCIENLNKLLKNTTNTTEIFKIKHNMAITKYLCEINSSNLYNEFSEEKLLLELEEIKQSTKKHSNHQFPILIYNQAVLYYKKEKYKKVLELLEPLFESLDLNDQHTTQLLKYDEFLVLKICFLLLDIYIDVMKCVEKTLIVIKYIDNNFQSIIQSSIPSLPQLNITELSITESKFNIFYYKSKISVLRKESWSTTLEYINSANQIIKNAIAKDNENKYINDLMATKLCLLDCFLKITKKSNNEETFSQMMKECIEILGQHRGRLSPVVYFNNLGCLFLHMDNKEPSIMSQFYFSKASQSGNAQAQYNLAFQLLLRESKNIEQVARCLSQNNPFLEPYELFHKASLSMYDNPYIWIRMGECILCENQRLLKKDIHETFQQMTNSLSNSPTVSLPVLGNQLGVKKFSTQKEFVQTHEDPMMKQNKYHLELLNDRFTPKVLEEMSLEMAEKCFHNALSILQTMINEFKKRYQMGENVTNEDHYQVSFFVRLQQALMNVTLKLAYVSLALDNPLLSLSHCKTILSLSLAYSNNTSISIGICPIQYTIIALCYAFEALTTTDQSEKIFQLISPQQLQTLLSYLQQQQDNSTLQFGLLLNLAVIHVIQGNYEKAQQTLNHITSDPQTLHSEVKPYFYLIQLYVLIVEGKTKQALELIANSFGHLRQF